MLVAVSSPESYSTWNAQIFPRQLYSALVSAPSSSSKRSATLNFSSILPLLCCCLCVEFKWMNHLFEIGALCEMTGDRRAKLAFPGNALPLVPIQCRAERTGLEVCQETYQEESSGPPASLATPDRYSQCTKAMENSARDTSTQRRTTRPGSCGENGQTLSKVRFTEENCTWFMLYQFTPKFKKSILPTFLKRNVLSEVVRIGSIIIFYQSKLWKAKFFILYDVIFLVTAGEIWNWSLLLVA